MRTESRSTSMFQLRSSSRSMFDLSRPRLLSSEKSSSVDCVTSFVFVPRVTRLSDIHSIANLSLSHSINSYRRMFLTNEDLSPHLLRPVTFLLGFTKQSLLRRPCLRQQYLTIFLIKSSSIRLVYCLTSLISIERVCMIIFINRLWLKKPHIGRQLILLTFFIVFLTDLCALFF